MACVQLQSTVNVSKRNASNSFEELNLLYPKGREDDIKKKKRKGPIGSHMFYSEFYKNLKTTHDQDDEIYSDSDESECENELLFLLLRD
ncbi:unnamed protein product [Acanthoscelides obtectus]|uniref:Uncharacterized protein n=1 Tax=Acanthoscelides obtectus TaxID=200917 RepID=A0A9P0Q0S3_ACAOB|nr:unnamed protein product [Acanthoscelides obtectus]CAK1664103.1 hypothetical protein AOBTE_LOCUS24053 [Acanthoscelides obtectus]